MAHHIHFHQVSSPNRTTMAAVVNLEYLNLVSNLLRTSYMGYVVVTLVVMLLLKLAVSMWSSRLATVEPPVCPPVNPNMHYPYGVAQMKGRRPYMEDRHVAQSGLNGDPTLSFYGIFDGHGGDGAANYCVQAMCQNIIREPSLTKDPTEALRKGFLRTDYEYLKIANRLNSEDGTTAVVVLAHGDNLYVAHAGDSRAVLVHTSGKVTALTSDHKPNRSDERKRIHDLGGSVVFWGVWRVEGILAVSRAIGDRMLKPFVVAEPEIKELHRSKTQDLFLIAASDGVWDALSSDEAGQLAMNHDDPQRAAQEIMLEAYERGSLDNICVMVIDLRDKKDGASQVSEHTGIMSSMSTSGSEVQETDKEK